MFAFFFGTSIKCFNASLQNNIVDVVSQTSNLKEERENNDFAPLRAPACRYGVVCDSSGRVGLHTLTEAPRYCAGDGPENDFLKRAVWCKNLNLWNCQQHRQPYMDMQTTW